MDSTGSHKTSICVAAVDHLHSDGSVVHSGIALADAILGALESGAVVEVLFDGLKGASSSYFNAFLRRIQEGCGLAALDDCIRLNFTSKVQEMVYARSLKAIQHA